MCAAVLRRLLRWHARTLTDPTRVRVCCRLEEKSDRDRKIALRDCFQNARNRLIKLLVLVKWSAHVPAVKTSWVRLPSLMLPLPLQLPCFVCARPHLDAPLHCTSASSSSAGSGALLDGAGFVPRGCCGSALWLHGHHQGCAVRCCSPATLVSVLVLWLFSSLTSLPQRFS
jgi:hypothetical protein